MTAKDLELMLGLEKPWRVTSLEIDHAARKARLHVACEEATTWVDPSTGQALHIHGWQERTWRHLDFWQYETVLVARVPRVRHPQSGETMMAPVPWAAPHSRWTVAFERLALEVLQAARSIEDACQLLRLHWDSAHTIMKRAVNRGLARREATPMAHVGIDEKSFGCRQRYATVLSDISGRRVLEVTRGATKEAALAAFTSLPVAQRQGIAAVAMDRSSTYQAAVEEALPQAQIVHDAYHLSADLNKALDQVRRREHAVLLAQGDHTLSHTKYLWLANPLNMSADRLTRFESLARLALKTSRAWEIKELFGGFWEQKDAQQGAEYFAQWHRRTQRCRLEPMKKLGQSFKASLPRLLNWFAHPISNALAEGFNSVIQAIKSTARGFRNFEHYRLRILFLLGKLDLSLP